MALIEAAINFNGTTSGIRSSYNVASIVNLGVGRWTINFTAPISDLNYTALCNGGKGVTDSQAWFSAGPLTNDPTTTAFTLWTGTTAAAQNLQFSYFMAITI